jgi:hypothetical protein
MDAGAAKRGTGVISRVSWEISAPAAWPALESAVNHTPPDGNRLEFTARRGARIMPHKQPSFRADGHDPTKIVQLAVEDAVSLASVLLPTKATLTQIPESEE